MKNNFLTLQPDHRGVVNVGEQVFDGAEFSFYTRGGSTTGDNQAAQLNGGGVPNASYSISDNTAATDTTKFVQREGPVVLPFLAHALGEGRGAFCGDSRIVAAIASEASFDALSIHDAVTLMGWHDALGMPTLSKLDSNYTTHGVIRGVIETGANRTSDGTASSSATAARTIYIVQVSGIVKVKTDSTVTPEDTTAGTSMYGSDDTVKLYDEEKDVFLGYYFGKALADNPSLRTTAEYSYVSLAATPPAAVVAETWAFGYTLSGASITVLPGTVRIHGKASYAITTNSVISLSGSPEWVFVNHVYSSGVTSIAHSSTEPLHTGDELRLPLYYLVPTDPANYVMTRILHKGDFNLGGIIR